MQVNFIFKQIYDIMCGNSTHIYVFIIYIMYHCRRDNRDIFKTIWLNNNLIIPSQ